MKKVLFIVLALAAVVACNKTEVVEQSSGNAITFDNAFIDNATKSVTDPSFTNSNMFDDFAVYGFVEGASIFDGTTVSQSIENTELISDWRYEGTQYWIAGAKYNFCAVAPKTGGNWVKGSCNVSGTAISTVLNFTNTGEVDLLYAQPAQIEGKVSENEKVSFSFRHALSKVKFSFTNAYNATNATIKVKNIKITNSYKTGTASFDQTNTSWSNHLFAKAGEEAFVLDFGMATDNESTTDIKENEEVAYAYDATYESQKELFMIPGPAPKQSVTVEGTATEVTGYCVTFKVALLISNQQIDEYTHTAYVNFAPVAGYCYDIKAEINAENIDPEHQQEPIEFTVATLPEWGTPNNVDAN